MLASIPANGMSITFIIPAVLVYFLPAIIGLRKKNFLAIMVLNLLLGWTGVGWVVCLVWALLKEESKSP